MSTFTKMHGLGNDFVVFDATRQPLALTPEKIRRLADRRFGVGCDQVLVIEPATRADVDFRYRIYNADGGEVEQCGNGARCMLRFARDKGLTQKTEILRHDTQTPQGTQAAKVSTQWAKTARTDAQASALMTRLQDYLTFLQHDTQALEAPRAAILPDPGAEADRQEHAGPEPPSSRRLDGRSSGARDVTALCEGPDSLPARGRTQSRIRDPDYLR